MSCYRKETEFAVVLLNTGWGKKDNRVIIFCTRSKCKTFVYASIPHCCQLDWNPLLLKVEDKSSSLVTFLWPTL